MVVRGIEIATVTDLVLTTLTWISCKRWILLRRGATAIPFLLIFGPMSAKTCRCASERIRASASEEVKRWTLQVKPIISTTRQSAATHLWNNKIHITRSDSLAARNREAFQTMLVIYFKVTGSIRLLRVRPEFQTQFQAIKQGFSVVSFRRRRYRTGNEAAQHSSKLGITRVARNFRISWGGLRRAKLS